MVAGCPVSPVENAHTARVADGRLADSAFVVPMCRAHAALLQQSIGTMRFEALYRIDLATEAVDTELRWRREVLARRAIVTEDIPGAEAIMFGPDQ